MLFFNLHVVFFVLELVKRKFCFSLKNVFFQRNFLIFRLSFYKPSDIQTPKQDKKICTGTQGIFFLSDWLILEINFHSILTALLSNFKCCSTWQRPINKAYIKTFSPHFFYWSLFWMYFYMRAPFKAKGQMRSHKCFFLLFFWQIFWPSAKNKSVTVCWATTTEVHEKLHRRIRRQNESQAWW